MMDKYKIKETFDNIKSLFSDMSFLTNLIALYVLLLGYVSPYFSKELQNIGLFALSGSITNWLAIHMLFEKIPFLYGSGIIELRFKDFKSGIKDLVMCQFFNKDESNKFLSKINKSVISNLESTIDFGSLYKQLVGAIISSPAGSIIAMMGGKSVLEPLKVPIINKIKDHIKELSNSDLEINSDNTESFILEVDKIISDRIDKLTPIMVKKIIQDIIKKHLGWLVVWGGVFGGLIGLIASIIG
jgi:uncharacterized membrane protein YheB (UPF0754 family)